MNVTDGVIRTLYEFNRRHKAGIQWVYFRLDFEESIEMAWLIWRAAEDDARETK